MSVVALFLVSSITVQVVASQPQIELTVEDKEVASVSDLFWGTNALYWVDDDAALKDGRIADKLSKIPCKLLRYPGGTVADNFDWREAVLFNDNMFPYESGSTETNFEEFMAFCGDVGAEPILVVNTQTWALRGDIERGAAEAAAWVQYCKDNGHKVRFWEIGNETYWHPVMSAIEYGELVNVYAKAMRAVDPEIILSVNGHWKVDFTGTKERLQPDEAEKFNAELINASSREDYSTIEGRVKAALDKDFDPEHRWWSDLLGVCGDNVDMLSVHWYFFANNLNDMDRYLSELKAHVKALKPEKEYLWCMSEFNCNEKGDAARVTGFAEAVCRFIYAGYDLGCFWPMRIGGFNNRIMFSRNELQDSYVYSLYRIFARELKGDMMARRVTGGVYAAVSQSDEQTTIMVSTRNLNEQQRMKLNLDNIPKAHRRHIEISSYVPVAHKQGLVTLSVPEKVEFDRGREAIEFDLRPKSVNVIILNKNKR